MRETRFACKLVGYALGEILSRLFCERLFKNEPDYSVIASLEALER